jgi:preprotein translocase subunit SecE
MSNQTVETVSSGADRAKVAVALMVFVAGIVGYYLLDRQPVYVRYALVLAGLALGLAIGWFSGPGQQLVAFGRDAWAETQRVTWPSRKETTQMTLVVFGFVLATAVFLWVVDKSLEWVFYDLILGWKR